MAANETSRVQSIDVLRTLALLCVLSIHSLRAAIAQVNGQDLSGLTGNQIAASCAIGLSTLGVPLFLMISGYLLMDRDYTKERTLTFFKRNLLPLIVSYEIFDLALAVVQYIGAGGVTVADYVKSALFIGPAPMGHLWYMQAIVGAYLLVPLLALLLHAVRERGLEPYAYAVLACLFVCYSVLPSVNQIMALQGNAFRVVSALDMFGITEPRFLLYMVFGYMVRQGFGMRTAPVAVYAGMVAALAVLCVSAAWSNLHADGFQSSLAFTPVVLGGCMLFLAVVRALRGRRIPNALYRPVRSVAVCSYGMYVLHYPVVLFMKYAPLPVHGWALYACIMAVAFIISYAVVWLASRYPLAAKWLFLMK